MRDLCKAAEQALRQLQKDDVYLGHRSKTRADAIEALRQALAQPKREWVGLTDDEREHFRKLGFVGVLAVENTLKEKNS